MAALRSGCWRMASVRRGRGSGLALQCCKTLFASSTSADISVRLAGECFLSLGWGWGWGSGGGLHGSEPTVVVEVLGVDT